MLIAVPKSLIGVWSIAAGAICLVIGMFAREFYGISGLNQKTTKQRVDPALGRLFFCIVGAGTIMIGVLYLLFAKSFEAAPALKGRIV